MAARANDLFAAETSLKVLRIVVYGNPAPQGSKSFKGMITRKGGGRPIANLQESSKFVKPWRQDVVAAAISARATHCKVIGEMIEPLDGALSLRMVFTLPKPASAPKRRRSWPNKKPDVSKLARSTEDALTTAGIWADDARVVEYTRLAKVFPGEDPDALDSVGVVIEIRLMT